MFLFRCFRRKHSSDFSCPKSKHTTRKHRTSHIFGNGVHARDQSSDGSRRSGDVYSRISKHSANRRERHRKTHDFLNGYSNRCYTRDTLAQIEKHDGKRTVCCKKEELRRDDNARRKVSHDRHKQKSSNLVSVGDVIKRRFRVEKILGEGSYGEVFECFDLYTNSLTAVKALKPQDDYCGVARHELNVLETISSLDTKNCSHCILSLDFFDWHNHFFIVFPLLGRSVFSFLELNNYEPYSIDQSAFIIRQVCEGVAFLHRIGITHTDLKPENILFVDSSYDEVYSEHRKRNIKQIRNPMVKLIDFGSATFDTDHHSTIIQTRHYRAPEIVMELGWDHSADVWSIGCILFELITGQCLFMTHDNLEHLAMMERVLGPIPKSLVKASRRRRYFRHGRLDWCFDSSESRYVRRTLKPLGEYWFLSPCRYHRLAIDLVREMLVYISSERITCIKSLEHPFILSFNR